MIRSCVSCDVIVYDSFVRVRMPACVWLIDLCVCVCACVHVELACYRWEEECRSMQQDGAAGRPLALQWKGFDDALLD